MLFQCSCGNTSKALEKTYHDDHKIHDVPHFKLITTEDNDLAILCSQCKKITHLESSQMTREELNVMEGDGE